VSFGIVVKGHSGLYWRLWGLYRFESCSVERREWMKGKKHLSHNNLYAAISTPLSPTDNIMNMCH
jgi:hypothetical protein